MARRFTAGLIVALLAGLNVYAWWVHPPGSYAGGSVELGPPFTDASNLRYRARVNVSPSGRKETLREEPVQLLEDAKPIGVCVAVREGGADTSARAEWTVYFFTSDDSDPNVNGRRYAVRFRADHTQAFYLVILLAGYLGAAVVLQKVVTLVPSRRAGLRMVCNLLVAAGLAVALAEGACWIVLEADLRTRNVWVRQWFDRQFAPAATDFFPGAYVNYVEHHYMNYALNPAQAYGLTRQFDATYRIRRTEKIRPRSAVKWRALVLGGSTTFGEMVPREADTWVYQLEKRVRARCGDGCDVINGGVGGYTVLENLIHFVALLGPLDPDVVILYEGINDVHPRLFDVITDDYSNYRVPWRTEGRILPPPSPALSWSTPYRLYYLRRHILRIAATGISYLVTKPYPPVAEWQRALERNPPEVYRRHLEDLVRLLQSQGRRVVIAPQYFTTRLASDPVFGRGVEEHNRVDEQVATAFGCPFVGELIVPGTFEASDTFDNCHFTEAGGAKMAAVVVDFLASHHLLPDTP